VLFTYVCSVDLPLMTFPCLLLPLPACPPLPHKQNGGGEVVGEVHQRWHLWQRKYDLYIGERLRKVKVLPVVPLDVSLAGP
jgi:hypothetical protein